MPSKRKSSSSSPQRRVSITDSSSVPSSSAGLPLPPAMSDNREDVFSNMCEMFPNLDSSLVEMVLSEYKEVEIVMDYLLELSTATKGNTQKSTGFDTIASFLDDFQIESQGAEHFEDVPDQIEEQENASYMDETMCNDLDTLLDEALDRYGLNGGEPLSSTEQCKDMSLFHNIIKPELDQIAAIHDTSFHPDDTKLIDQLKADVEREENTCALDSDVATLGTSLGVAETAKLESAPDTTFSSLNCSNYGATYSQENVGSVEKLGEVNHPCTVPTSIISHVKLSSTTPKSQTKWNPMASSFYPVFHANPSFIAPVAVNPSQWPCIAGRREPVAGVCYNPPPPRFVWNFNQSPQTHWTAGNIRPVSKAQSGPQISKKVTQFIGKVLVLLRGAPGSGKSTLARLLLEYNPTAVLLSTDDYFSHNGQYQFDISCLGEAHEWNHKRAKDAFEKNVSPIIIDNTNLQGWEMKPYVSMAVEYKYKVTFREPDTWWKYRPKELERRNRHGLKKEKIIKMLESYERVTVNSILNLSRPKASENAENSQGKTEEKIEELNVLPQSLKAEETAFCKTPESGNMEDMESEAPDRQKIFEDGSEMVPVLAGSNLKNLTTTVSARYVELFHLLDNIHTENKEQRNEDCSSEESVEAAVDKQGPDIDSGESILNARPELLNFVGDWPLEQTMRTQRRRKARARREKHNTSVQKSGENDAIADADAEHIEKAIEHEQIDNRSSEQDQLKEGTALKMEYLIDSSTVDYDEEHLLGLEKQLCTSLTLHNKDDGAEGEVQFKGMFIDKPSDIQEQVAESTNGQDIPITSSVEDVKIKPRPPRRNCRHCKLALNFTNNCAISSKHEDPLQECDSSQNLQQPSVGLCNFSQTEPQDFALAWRIENINVDVLDSAKILIGKSSRFKSKILQGSSDAAENIPYRAMHHKSTFVEEDDIISLGDKDSLDILCKLFKSLSFDVLKDLFERCDKDIEWTTNLLLDSGEKFYKNEECEDLELQSHADEDTLQNNFSVIIEEKSVIIAEEQPENVETDFTNHSFVASEYSPFVNALPLVAEELKNGNILTSNEINLGHPCRISSELFQDHETITNPIASHLMWPSALQTQKPNTQDSSLDLLQDRNTLKTIQKDNQEEINSNNANLSKNSDMHRPEVLVDETNEEQEFTEVSTVVEEEKKTQNKSNSRSQSKESLQFDYLELALPPEFAFQLTELFGPVGIDPGSLTIEDCVVPIDLKLAESIHKKWKESIMERHRQEALSHQLIFQDSLPDYPVDLDNPEKLLSEVSQRDTDLLPFMDQWNTRIKKVSMRQIIAEEMALQAHEDSKKSLSSKNCAEKLKEKQLLEMFPHVEQQLLMDIFKENNYSLAKTEQFMSSVLEADPVQNVIALGFKPSVSSATDKTKEKKLKAEKEILNERSFQDLEYPDYDDFRAEAFLYHQKQQESFRKAAEAHNRGMTQVAAYYAQQGYLYGQKMKEENRRAAVQIFERANEYLLPENILDLHGLHVDEAMKHFRKVLQDKTDEFKQNGGKPHLLVITGRGNHSQGGVPRIKPAVIDFLTNHDYRVQEKTPGVFRITLK
ncbi:NEDD4-binding protein 2 [Rhinoderma darwinii]|uniref:NEDD4-binding protein 2 n=1 Tax=Rhinoderma darwinii TaxID=43563 RepID=UPI003F66B053